MNPPFPKSYWLEPGRILCGEYPRECEDSAEQKKMAAILGSGVRAFVDLTEEGELKSYRDLARETARSLGIDPGELEFHRHPITDVSVPRDPATMPGALRTLRSARHRRRPAYLHCWGGRGRTGTAAGCLLADLLRLPGDEALAALGERWRRCAKSADSNSPETAEQTGFVRAWNPVASAHGDDSFPARVRGAVLGAAVGDALGVPVEFRSRAERRSDPVEVMRAHGTHGQPAGTWSDDTSMILATLDAVAETGGSIDAGAIMHAFARWMRRGEYTPHGEVFDIGNATRSAIQAFLAGTPAAECGGGSEWSNGNGSLMRILPVALARADDPELVEVASSVSALTHAHERSRFCCAFYCVVANELLHGSSVAEATAFAWEVMDARWTFSAPERERFERLHPDELLGRDEDDIGSSGHVIDTLEAALWVNHRHDDYAGAVLHAVNLGDDTDTTGCVAGGLAGLIHGVDGIPGEWRDALVGHDAILDPCDRFAATCPTGFAGEA